MENRIASLVGCRFDKAKLLVVSRGRLTFGVVICTSEKTDKHRRN